MKLKLITLILLLATCAVVVWVLSMPERATEESTELQPLEEAALPAESSPSPPTPRQMDAPVAAEEPKRPVQSLEERGDAMLFESDALHETPFDEAVVMPFE